MTGKTLLTTSLHSSNNSTHVGLHAQGTAKSNLLTFYNKQCCGDNAGDNVGGYTLVDAMILLAQINDSQIPATVQYLCRRRQGPVSLKPTTEQF